MQANIATMTPDGIVVLLAPLPLVDTKSGPHTALTATAIHIAVIASDAQTSDVMCSSQCCRSGTGCCETVDIFDPPFPAPTFARQRGGAIRESAERARLHAQESAQREPGSDRADRQ